MDNICLKPKKRTKLRILIGTYYYVLKRRGYWLSGAVNFAKTRDSKPYVFSYYNHSTPFYSTIN